jgi:hypothetical protein
MERLDRHRSQPAAGKAGRAPAPGRASALPVKIAAESQKRAKRAKNGRKPLTRPDVAPGLDGFAELLVRHLESELKEILKP